MKKILASMMMVAVLSIGFVGASGVVNEHKVEAAAATKVYVTINYTSQIQYSSMGATYKANGYTYKGTVYNSKSPACYAKAVTNSYSGWLYR